MSRDAAALRQKLAGIVGEEFVLAAPDASGWAVDGVEPAVVVRPASQEQVAAVAAACNGLGAAMVAWNGPAGIALGNPPGRVDAVVSLDRLSRIVEFDAANLCVSVEAGVTLDALQDVLRAKKEFLPLDPPQGDVLTVGDLIQNNASGPSRLLYGPARDWVLGLRVALPTGERIRCGGKVIKNVSGYDLNKVFIGNLGTLGIVTEATFKLLPSPTARATVAGLFGGMSDVFGVVARTLESFLLPEALEALGTGALDAVRPELGPAGPEGCGLVVSVAGSQETVDRQVRDFRSLFERGKALAVETLGGDREGAAWRAIRDSQARLGPDRVVARVAVPIGRTPDLFFSAEGLLKKNRWAGTVTAHAGSGVVRVGIGAGDGMPLEALREALVALRGEAEAAEGSLVVEAAPAALKRSLDAWGAPRGGVSVMRRLKAEFDPQAVMAPGRFLSGI